MSSAPVASSVVSSSPAVAAAPAVITLAGKVAIITGASRGIGRGIALSLARDGAKIVVNYQSDKKSADAVVAAITSLPGRTGDAIAVQGDASKADAIDRLFAEAKRVYGRVDIVVANAGVGIAPAPIASTSTDDFMRITQTNLIGTFYTLRAAANMVENNGRIIVIGSGTKSGTFPGYGPYAMTKAAVEVLANTLAQELGGRGITVNTIHPGAIDTDMLQGLTANAPGIIDYMASVSPMKRVGTISDIGDAAALLASESGRWISGQNIRVDGAAKV